MSEIEVILKTVLALFILANIAFALSALPLLFKGRKK